jgi:hypothetical protein
LLLVTHSKAAIHGNYCACDVRSSRAGKKSYNACYFIYRRGAPKGNGGGKVGESLGAECRSHVGVDWAWCHDIDSDVP